MQIRDADFSLLLLRDTDIDLQTRWACDRPSMLHKADDQDHLPTVVAVQNGCIVGAARLYRYRVHPTRWRLAIYVQAEYRRRGIGTALFEACLHEGEIHGGDEIQVGIATDDSPYFSFLAHLGFSTLMTTHVGELPWRDILQVEVGRSPATIVSLAMRPDLRETVADLHEDIYRAQHAWSPVGEITDRFRASIFLDPDELVPDAQFIAILEEQPVGISSLRAPFSIASPDMGWIGVVETIPDSLAVSIHQQLFDACLQYAKQVQADILFEVDESDPRTLQRCRSLHVHWQAPWLNMIRRV